MVDPGTLAGLDWGVVLLRLQVHARTHRGKALAVVPEFAEDAEEARQRYAVVTELWSLAELGGELPLGSVMDISEPVTRAARGEVLEAPVLQDIGNTLEALCGLSDWCAARAEEAPALGALAGPIEIERALAEDLILSFDAEGQLSGERYPDLARLRRRHVQLRASIRRTLEAMLADPAVLSVLQERFITDRNGRFVLPVRSGSRRGMGIVHDTSQSGETAYVEPTEVVEPQNELKEVGAEIRREERRILSQLSALVGEAAPVIHQALDAATQLDLAGARAHLGTEMDARIPQVGEDGVMHLLGARHPVLVLRGVPVVANDLRVDSGQPGLVLSGPNAGGKTVALKTLGLAALMVRSGIPVPARDESRVDWMQPIRALVGDQQALSDDLSTFSAQLLGVRQALEHAGPGSLLLLDELGMGTDPAQGSALAQAVVEALVEDGARVILTTHHAALKELAASDPRWALAGAVFADGRPTYRIETGRTGHSHALAVARQMELPDGVLERARALLDEDSRRMDDLITRLETEQEEVHRVGLEQAERTRNLEAREHKLTERAARLDARRDRDQAEALAAFRARLGEEEAELKQLIKLLQGDPNLRDAASVLDAVKEARSEAAPAPVVPEEPVESVAPGDQVTVLGGKGTVVSVQGDRVEVEVRGKRVKVRLAELGRAPASPQRPKPRPYKEVTDSGPVGVRTQSNTLDLRGMRVEESIDAVSDFLDRMMLDAQTSAYLLHGHGTGALKQAIREWLPRCPHAQKWHRGGPEEGGDAFTVVEL